MTGAPFEDTSMTTPTIETPAAATQTCNGELSFDQRWAAWEGRGLAQDRATRRRMALLAPLVVVAAGILYALVGR